MTKRELLRLVGDVSQLFGVKDYTLNDGMGKGVRAIDVKTEQGLCFTVLPDRSMDISNLSYKGVNVSYISSTGVTSPQHFTEMDGGFQRGFFGGFLTTCGLSNVGIPCVIDGKYYGQHGRIHSAPASNIAAEVVYSDDVPEIVVRGTVRETQFFGINLVMTREIKIKMGENCFRIHDEITNDGFSREPLMLLYHFNMGYPFLDEGAKFIANSTVVPRDEEAASGIETYNEFTAPQPNYKEQVFYHDINEENGMCRVAMHNPKLPLTVSFAFPKSQLPRLSEWKQMGEGAYVVGIEPSICHVGGRKAAIADGTIKYIEPGETKKFDITIEITNK